jgi:hypothetical protein
MTDFSQKRFVDIGQTLYIQWLKDVNNPMDTSEEGRRLVYNFFAKVAFEAAEEFAKVFNHQEDN